MTSLGAPSGMVTALRTLTILPVPGREARSPAAALPWFPVVGGLVGLALYGAARLAYRGGGGGFADGAALAVVVGGVILTRGLHLDGLADTADAFGGARDKERALQIMKDSRIGAFGVLAIVAALLTKWAAVVALARAGGLLWVTVACVISRLMMVELAATFPYARAEGGTGSVFVEGARPRHRLLAHALGMALALGVMGPAGGALLVIAWLFTRLFGAWCRRRVGGVTGDLLGACSEMTEALALLSAALAGPYLAPLTGWGPLF
ncbi:MAG: adenosylcobinamide-GDP ribazoletransferase [Planctomycetes bacterium]|nr:adenosylcobinamide-GDP ribazoletransferase [Planctomycetota bacterium]